MKWQSRSISGKALGTVSVMRAKATPLLLLFFFFFFAKSRMALAVTNVRFHSKRKRIEERRRVKSLVQREVKISVAQVGRE